ncbi:MAG: HlyD family efflux transporter periplasmic adaptor subunit, partial [Tissierella sp.]|uniref:HlyD family efflux transporter periplasmic adaptor subunit n=1 Tax=Tissierella sp. TaxID=41274 RepID=UPI003F9E537F
MSYEQRKKNRQRREKRYKIFIISIGIILFTIILFSLINIKRNTILAVEDVFLKEIELQSVLIKSEKVFTLEDTKDIDTSILEGKKIPAGIKVGNSTVLNDLNLLRKELKEVEKAISTLTNTNKDQVFKNDKKKLKENYNQSIEKIQEDIYSKNYKNIKKYKEEIILIDKDLEDLLPQNTLLGQSIDNLNDKKKNIKEEINQKDSSYISESSGIISYRIDGYENILKPQGFENYTYDKLSISNKSKEETVGRKEKNDIKGFKIIDNFEWYLALKIDDRKNIQKYEIGDELFIKYPFKNSFMEIKGDIISINNTSNKSVIILKFNKYLHDLYNDR